MQHNRQDDSIGVLHLRKVIEELIDQIISKNPQLKLKLDFKQRQALVDNLLKVLEKGLGHEFERSKILEPEFSKKLTLCIMATLVLENQNHLQETLKHIFDAKKLDLNSILTMKPNEFKEFMTKNFTHDELHLLHKHLMVAADQVCHDVENKFGAKFEPQAKHQLGNDLYTNLFGLLSSAIAGSLAVPIPLYIGNGLAFNDWNPNQGNAPIDQINSIKDTLFGDPQGLNAKTIQNYKALSDIVVEKYYPDALYAAGQNLGAVRPNLKVDK